MKNETRYATAQIVLETDTVRAVVLPELGAKIGSFVWKQNNFEVLAQPAKLPYRKAHYGADFSAYDTSGLDDCLPTIDSCTLPDSGQRLPDHGEVWAREWTVKTVDTADSCPSACLSVDLQSVPLHFEKEISLKDSTLHLKYTLTNEGEQSQPWLWALHDLTRWEEDLWLELPHSAEDMENVQEEEPAVFDKTRASQYPNNSTFKWYYPYPVRKGQVSVHYPSQGMKYTISYDETFLPYLGLWVTTGGFKGEKNFALEPCNGYYDSLCRAVENNTAMYLEAKQTVRWEVFLKLEEETNGFADL